MFSTFFVSRPPDFFHALKTSVCLENIGPGRFAATLVDDVDKETHAVPLVRTTTVYHLPAQWVSGIHKTLWQDVQRASPLAAASQCDLLPFNNAMLELYTPQYRKMRFHTDQSLDLMAGSHIAIFSCYDSPQATGRKLVIKNGSASGVTQEITLENNMVVLFSLDTNHRHLHKIVLCDNNDGGHGQWMGMTMRTSKTFVTRHDLHLASTEERRDFLHWRARENKLHDHVYPPHVSCTLSPSDLLLPIPALE